AWDAWTSFAWIDLILLLTVVVSIGMAVLAGLRVPMPMRPGAILTAFGGFSFLLALYRLISPPWSDAGREAAPWLSLLCLAAVIGGGVLSNRLQSKNREAARSGAGNGARHREKPAASRTRRRRPVTERTERDRRPAGSGFNDHN